MPGDPEYAELHCHSSYSLLDGASQPDELVARAQALGLRALALTDHDGLYITPTFCRLAETVNLQPIVGAELTLAPPVSPPSLGGRRGRAVAPSGVQGRSALAGGWGCPPRSPGLGRGAGYLLAASTSSLL